jgi:hypothetical protein
MLLVPSTMRRTTLAVCLFGVTLTSFAQSVADVARTERERQKASNSKVAITGTGAPAAAPDDAASKPPAASAAPATSEAAPSKTTELTDNKGHNEKYWRAAFQKARDDAKRADSRVELFDLKMKDLNTQLLRQSDIYNREYRLGSEMTSVQKELDDARKEAEQAKKKISDLEDELRKSGGPAGWAR